LKGKSQRRGRISEKGKVKRLLFGGSQKSKKETLMVKIKKRKKAAEVLAWKKRQKKQCGEGGKRFIFGAGIVQALFWGDLKGSKKVLKERTESWGREKNLGKDTRMIFCGENRSANQNPPRLKKIDERKAA